MVGIGANLPTDKLANKIDVVRRAITLNQPNPQDGVDVLAKVGGFDLVGMAGVMLGAASCGLPVLLDGFLSYAAALAACQMSPAIKPYLIPSHLSAEKGARIAGIGANLPTDKLANKIDVVRRAITLNQPNPQDGVDVLAKVGGFDLVGIAGVMLGAASCGLPVLLDGFLSYAAALAACQMSPAIKPYLIPSHLSAEKGARIALSHLGLEPYLNMEMRLGEGSGAALAMPIIEAACAIYNNMGELAASNIWGWSLISIWRCV